MSNTYDEIGDILGKGFNGLMQEGDSFADIPLSDIIVNKQVREEFEDEENPLSELIESIKKHGVVQSILVRPIEGDQRYELVCGERRYRASIAAGLSVIPAIIRVLSEDQAAEIQFQENIQRKNLTLIETAKRIQKDLDTLGSIDAVLAKHNKGRSWLSKILSLLKLPEQAKRLITENISADPEVINGVKTIEKSDPEKAKEVVEELKATRGKADARTITNKAKDDVKPKKEKNSQAPSDQKTIQENPLLNGSESDNSSPSSANSQPIEVGNLIKFRGSESEVRKVLDGVYNQVFNREVPPDTAFQSISEPESVDAWLKAFYDAGCMSEIPAVDVLRYLRSNAFSSSNSGAYAMVAFIQGTDPECENFDVLNIVGLVKP